MANYSLVQTNSPSDQDNRSKSYDGFSFILGLVSVIVGGIYLHSGEEDCPWSPQLPVYLLTYGVINLGLPVLCCCIPLLPSILLLVINFGLTIWGFVLLYSNPNAATYSQYGPNSTVVNDNFCTQVVYIVPMVVTWLSTIGYIIVVSVCVCLGCALCCAK